MDRVITTKHLGFTLFKDGNIKIFEKREERDDKTKIYHFLNLQDTINEFHYDELHEYVNFTNFDVLAAALTIVGDIVFLNVSSPEVGSIGLMYLPKEETIEQQMILNDLKEYLSKCKLVINRYFMVTNEDGSRKFKCIGKYNSCDEYYEYLKNRNVSDNNYGGRNI